MEEFAASNDEIAATIHAYNSSLMFSSKWHLTWLLQLTIVNHLSAWSFLNVSFLFVLKMNYAERRKWFKINEDQMPRKNGRWFFTHFNICMIHFNSELYFWNTENPFYISIKEKGEGPLQTDHVSSTGAAVSLSSAVVSPVYEAPKSEFWFDPYLKTVADIVAMDIEFVSKPISKGSKSCLQHIATIDIVDFDLQTVYSSCVFHEPGSFKVDRFTKALTNFTESSFSDPSYPSESKVQAEVKEILKEKLVITCGGESDYNALGLDMADFNSFDLQSHFYLDSVDRYGVINRQPHSLRSLSLHFLQQNQNNQHTSQQDAILTMKLFHKYIKEKRDDDRENWMTRMNYSRPYNLIQVLPHPLKSLKKKK